MKLHNHFLHMKILILFFMFLAGCSSVVPSRPAFPEVPEILLTFCKE